MAIYPGAAFRPLGPQTQALMPQVDIVCLHTMVGSLWGTDTYFHSGGYDGTESHFGVGYNGETLQWQDTARTADANLNGNWHVVSIETADIGTGFPVWDTNDGGAVPAWTPAQVDALARLVAWCCQTHNIPCEMIPDSKPGRRGVGYHRQGVDPYRVAGGELWSSAYAKACPGDRRIAQIPTVISKAQLILRGELPLTLPTLEDDLMAHIPLDVAADGTFRTGAMAETDSAVASDAYITCGSLWGKTNFVITAHRQDGYIFYQWTPEVLAGHQWSMQLPAGTRLVAIEGFVEVLPTATERGTTATAAIWTLPADVAA